MDSKQEVLERYHQIKSVCNTFAGSCCIAVSKRQQDEKINWIYEAGHRDFGESYFQEWEAKKQRLPNEIRWHFVGQIQSRKVKPLCEQGIFSIHSLGSDSSLKKWLAVEEKPNGPNFLQLNLEKEEQKGGMPIESLKQLEQEGVFEALNGLMTIPPKSLSEAELQRHFKKMRQICDELNLKYLSMGMSSDWNLALKEGATHVRIGTALFGERAV
jgi:pyridoxal phosphate enzyme (YggS family)